MNRDNVTYFDSFGVEHIPREIEKLIGNKNIQKKLKEYNQMIQY